VTQSHAAVGATAVAPFNRETAGEKVRLAEDAWNPRDPTRVGLMYPVNSQWRNRAEFVSGRQDIVAFLRGVAGEGSPHRRSGTPPPRWVHETHAAVT
jgi:nuclear transport factor 2 (NTF2) superfamily protein